MNSADTKEQIATLSNDIASIFVTTADGQTRTVAGVEGLSLMQVIRDAGIDDLPAYCGGACSCASCHVHVAAEWMDRLPAISEDEADLLGSVENRTAYSRLSCQIPCTPALDGLHLTTAYVE